MSSTNRTTSKGGKGNKSETGGRSHNKNDRSDTGKSGDKLQPQATAEQIRIAKIMELRSEDPLMKDKVRQLLEMSRKSEDEVYMALHDCDNDVDRAAEILLEGSAQDGWKTRMKKKKSKQAAIAAAGSPGSNSKGDNIEAQLEDNEMMQSFQPVGDKEKSRTRGGGPPRMRGRGRGRENRENRENDKGQDDGMMMQGGGMRRGRMSNGPGRGGGQSRGGGRGGRMSSRTFQPRDNRNSFPTTVETWDSNDVNNTVHNPDSENWDVWEEYTGSLADTKVFTPSANLEKEKAEQVVPPEPSALPVPDLPPASSMEMRSQPQQQQQQQQQQSQAQPASVVVGQSQQQSSVQQQQPPQPQPLGTLSAAQTQYLTQLTQQTSEGMKQQQQQQQQKQAASAGGYGAGSGVPQYAGAGSYGSPGGYGGYGSLQDSPGSVQQPTRTKTQRARVPPPSKIPSSAVEMPGEVSQLDVQFGAIDLLAEGNLFEADKFGSGTTAVLDSSSSSSGILDLNSQSQTSLDSYNSSMPKPTQTSISSPLTQSQMLSNTDSIPQTSDHISGAYVPSRSNVSGSVPPSVPAAPGLDMPKSSDVGLSYSQPQLNTYQSYQNQKSSSSVYQTQTYNSSNYSSNVQATSTSSYSASQPPSNYVNSNAGSYNTPSNAYQNSSYSSSSSYQANAPAFPSMSQTAASFPSNNQSSYQQSNAQSVYGSSTGLSNSGSSYSASNTNQYNSYSASSASHNHKLGSAKDQSYDSASTVSSNTVTTTSSVNQSPALGLTNSQATNTTSTKVTNSAAKSGAIANIPPGVTPIMGQYIMGQAGMQYFQTPMYSYEEMQLLQQRIPPHMTAGYYDMGGYQTPTTLGGGRENNLANVAYSMSSDGRFTRADNNASPVPSTLSQPASTQGHQGQPMLNALAPGYAYFTYGTAGMMPGGFQYGTPIYSQMPAATNTHGSTNSSQYPKPGSYGSAYGSGYDALSQSQDYGKSGYVGGSQSQSKSGSVGGSAATTGSSAGSDLSVMYSKSHAALGKVNSYEKQGFHSGTPPPFSLAGGQSASAVAAAAVGGTFAPQMYIPAVGPHQQHHSTTLLHQPLHQMDMRHPTRRMDSGNSSNQRSQSSSQSKSGAKQAYPNSYWNNA